MLKRTFILGVMVSISLLTITKGPSFAQSSKAELLQPQRNSFSIIEPNLKAKEGVTFTNYRFEQTSIKESEMSFLRAFKFKTPPWEGKLIWSFTNGGPSMENVYGWGIVASVGEMSGFRSFAEGTLKESIPGAPKEMSLIFQELPSQNLEPDTEYIIFFVSFVDEPFELWISLNMVQDKNLTYQDIFSHVAEFK